MLKTTRNHTKQQNHQFLGIHPPTFDDSTTKMFTESRAIFLDGLELLNTSLRGLKMRLCKNVFTKNELSPKVIGRGWDESRGSRERFFNGLGHLSPPKNES